MKFRSMDARRDQVTSGVFVVCSELTSPGKKFGLRSFEQMWLTNVVDWGMIDMNRYDITTVSQFRDSMSEKYFRHVAFVISYIHIYNYIYIHIHTLMFSVWKFLRKQLIK